MPNSEFLRLLTEFVWFCLRKTFSDTKSHDPKFLFHRLAYLRTKPIAKIEIPFFCTILNT